MPLGPGVVKKLTKEQIEKYVHHFAKKRRGAGNRTFLVPNSSNKWLGKKAFSNVNRFALTFDVTKNHGKTSFLEARLDGSFCRKQGQCQKNVIL